MWIRCHTFSFSFLEMRAVCRKNSCSWANCRERERKGCYVNVMCCSICGGRRREGTVTCLSGDLLGPAVALGVGLLGDPLAALVWVGEWVPGLLVEIGMAPRRPGLGLVIDLFPLVWKPLAQPHTSASFLLYVHPPFQIFWCCCFSCSAPRP